MKNCLIFNGSDMVTKRKSRGTHHNHVKVLVKCTSSDYNESMMVVISHKEIACYLGIET